MRFDADRLCDGLSEGDHLFDDGRLRDAGAFLALVVDDTKPPAADRVKGVLSPGQLGNVLVDAGELYVD